MKRYPLFVFLLVASVFVLAAGCGDDDDPGSPPKTDTKARIGIMHDDSTHTSMTSILETAGYEVTDLGFYADRTAIDFSDFDLVFMVTGYEYGEELPDSVQQGLLDFMDQGGTLVTNEWLGYSENNDLLIPVLPLTYDDDYCDDGGGDCIEAVTVDVDHALTKDLDPTFDTPPDYTYSFMVVNTTGTSTNAMNLMSGATCGAMLGVADWGSGHSIHWNTAGCYEGPDIWDANTTQILLNIADFAR